MMEVSKREGENKVKMQQKARARAGGCSVAVPLVRFSPNSQSSLYPAISWGQTHFCFFGGAGLLCPPTSHCRPRMRALLSASRQLCRRQPRQDTTALRAICGGQRGKALRGHDDPHGWASLQGVPTDVRRTPADSKMEMTEWVLPSMANDIGAAMGGKVMSWIGELAPYLAGGCRLLMHLCTVRRHLWRHERAAALQFAHGYRVYGCPALHGAHPGGRGGDGLQPHHARVPHVRGGTQPRRATGCMAAQEMICTRFWRAGGGACAGGGPAVRAVRAAGVRAGVPDVCGGGSRGEPVREQRCAAPAHGLADVAARAGWPCPP